MREVYIEAVHTQEGEPVLPKELLRPLRRADLFIRLGAVCARALSGSSQESDCGLVLASAFGPMETGFEVLDQVVEREAMSPTLFSHSVFNSAAGYIAMGCGLRGSLLTMTEFELPFFAALVQGRLAVADGRLQRCLVMQVESYSHLLEDARGGEPWPPGAVGWLLTAEKQERELCSVALRFGSGADRHAPQLESPLATAISATEAVRGGETEFAAVAAGGQVELTFAQV